MTYEVKEKQPVLSLLRVLKKFSHVSDDGLAEIQSLVDRRYNLLQALVKAQ